jgi:hypothetical protein
MLVDESEYASAAAAGLDYLRYEGQSVPAPERVALSLVQVATPRQPAHRGQHGVSDPRARLGGPGHRG